MGNAGQTLTEQQLFERVLGAAQAQLKKMVAADGSKTLSTVADVVAVLMDAVDEFPVPGATKASVVVRVATALVKSGEQFLPAPIASDLQVLLDNGLLTPVMTLAVDASDGVVLAARHEFAACGKSGGIGSCFGCGQKKKPKS